MINSTLGRAVTITDLLSGANGAPRTLNGSLPPRASAIIGELRLGIEISRVKAADMREQRPRQPAPLDLVFRRTVLQRLMQLTEGRVAQVSFRDRLHVEHAVLVVDRAVIEAGRFDDPGNAA